MTSLIDTSNRDLGQFQVGPIALGCWRMVAMPTSQAQECVEAALDAGINLIDNADVYGLDWGGAGFGAAEKLLGEVIKQAHNFETRWYLPVRAALFRCAVHSANLTKACEDSLKRLNTEQIDLYQIHRPTC